MGQGARRKVQPIPDEVKAKWNIEIARLNSGSKDGRWWYTPVAFTNGVRTHAPDRTDKDFYEDPSYGINKWHNFIQPHLPFPLKGKTVLDVGCNCALYSVMAVRSGAKKVIALEGDPGNNGFFEQAKLVLKIMSRTDPINYKRKIDLHNVRAEDFDYGNNRADIAFMFNILLWLDYPGKVIDEIKKSTNTLMIIGEEEDKPLSRTTDISELLNDHGWEVVSQKIPRVPRARKFNITVATL